MSKWTKADDWKRLCSGEACPVCLRGKPSNIIAELDVSFLTAGEETPLKGTCALFFKRHAVGIYELSSEEAAAFMRDLQRASKAVHEVTGGVKMNYEIHGNTIPHLHIHLFPRYVGDAFENHPINPRIMTTPVYASGEFSDFVARVQDALSKSGD